MRHGFVVLVTGDIDGEMENCKNLKNILNIVKTI